jgi:hypothetical protein
VAKDLVIVMPPEPLAIFLADRGYLSRGVPLIKPVLALAGQTVCREDLRIMVDDVYAGAAHSHDRLGRPLPEWRGCLIVGEDNVFLMNPNAPASLDGRYFGALLVSSMMVPPCQYAVLVLENGTNLVLNDVETHSAGAAQATSDSAIPPLAWLNTNKGIRTLKSHKAFFVDIPTRPHVLAPA